ncbi:LADA_0A08592g1_1 [Lachancea dasiensis]|uniref:LADA_0A08592g1_1 n=1 Tax=Lachancea dasiensis TaxID=1072105 RepID=A0A1G4IQC5_9SACH|nr:LADA_0A08592g1_1 [Lachancea dasiensis]
MLFYKQLTRQMSLAANRSIEGPIAQSITKKVRTKFPDLTHFALFNDSYKHAGHHGIAEAENKIESHFRLEIVSDGFQGLTLPKRHRLVYNLLDVELKEGVHALQLQTRTPAEHAKRQQQ